MSPDAKKILKFIEEIDKFKFVSRVIYLQKEGLMEDDAQHSWHLAMMVWVFSEQLEKGVNIEKALKMALMHDLVEIYAGDTFSFDNEGRKTKKQREDKAAQKLFRILPQRLKQEMLDLWNEYEGKQTPEAKFVQAMDKLHPVIQNILAKGKVSKEYKITEKMVTDDRGHHFQESQFLSSLFKNLTKKTTRKNYYHKD